MIFHTASWRALGGAIEAVVVMMGGATGGVGKPVRAYLLLHSVPHDH